MRANLVVLCTLMACSSSCGYFPTGDEQGPPNLIGSPDAMTIVDAKTPIDASPIAPADAAMSSSCETDADCGDNAVCDVTQRCASPDALHAVTVTWTVFDAPADAASCSERNLVALRFKLGNDWGSVVADGNWIFPCTDGKAVIDRVPVGLTYIEVTLHIVSDQYNEWHYDSWFKIDGTSLAIDTFWDITIPI